MDKTLVIMAAGLGSRYQNGIKQMEAIFDNKYALMEYSIYDAVCAGFNRVVIVLRPDIYEEFKNTIGSRIEKVIDCKYCIQDVPLNRKKPLGTAHAVLVTKNLIDTPFCVINADDYYGRGSFNIISEYLDNLKENEFCMTSFILKNTLSDNGVVSRGICDIDVNDYLKKINEVYNIDKNTNIDFNSYVSMNMWGFTPLIYKYLEDDFKLFLNDLNNIENKEFMLPNVIDKIIKNEQISVKVLKTEEIWYGMTYYEDKNHIIKMIENLIETHVYPKNLYEK